MAPVRFPRTNARGSRKIPLTILCAILTSACSVAPQPDLPAEIARQAQARIDLGYHLGTVIGIVDSDGPRYYGFGVVSPTDPTTPNEHSIFEIGSITKTFTATLLADLDLQDAMDLESPLDRYVPAFAGVVVRGGVDRITIESLVTHTSGLPREPTDLDPNADDRYATYSEEQLEALLSSGSLEASPGPYAYSNFGVMLLEHAIETAMDDDYENLLLERVTSRLGMHNTFLDVPREARARLVTGFRDGQTTAELDLGQFPSMGGLRSTAADMLIYLGAQIGLEDSALNRAIGATHELRLATGETAVGLGWHILKREESGKTIHFHKGGTNGFVSFAGFDLENRRAVVVLVNGTRWFSDLGFHLLDPTYLLADPE